MIVHQYGLKYTRITEKDLELVRYWRNKDYIKSTMQFQEYITPKMQKNWFQKIDNKNNYYFIIHHQNRKIGLINCKESELEKVSEGGIFIWDKNYWGTSIPAYASLSMLQAVFEIFKSGNVSLATVAIENKKAVVFNKILGYKIVGTTEDGKYYKMQLSIDDYYTVTKKISKAAGFLAAEDLNFELTASVNSKQTDEINNYINLKNGTTI